MLTKIEARNSQGALLTLPLDDVENGYLVKDVMGLDPVKATHASSSFANQDGEQYQASRRETRNIVIKLGLVPDYVTDQTPRDLRRALYQYFKPKSEVSLRLFIEDLEWDILGVVESCEAELFTEEPGVVISVICYDPDFFVATPVVISDETVDDSTNIEIDYDGDIETGILLELHVDRILAEFTIYHAGPDGIVRSLEFATDLETGDEVKISTVKGDKYATLLRSGITSSVLYAVSSQSTWVELAPDGVNTFRVYAEGDPIPYDLTYITKYGGL